MSFDINSPSGLYPGTDDAAYFAHPAISKSKLDAFVRGKELDEGRNLILGTAIHELLLRPDTMKAKYGRAPEANLTTKVGKETMAKWEADNPTLIGIRPKEYEQMMAARKAVMEHETAAKIIKAPGDVEIAAMGRFPGHDSLAKCKIDKKCRACIVDIKTTGYMDEDQFKNAIVDYGYAAQSAWYTELYAAITDEWFPMFFLCVSVRTFKVWVITMTPEQRAFGYKYASDMLTVYERINAPKLTESTHAEQ